MTMNTYIIGFSSYKIHLPPVNKHAHQFYTNVTHKHTYINFAQKKNIHILIERSALDIIYFARVDEYSVRKFKKPKPYKAYDNEVEYINICLYGGVFEGIYYYYFGFIRT